MLPLRPRVSHTTCIFKLVVRERREKRAAPSASLGGDTHVTPPRQVTDLEI